MSTVLAALIAFCGALGIYLGTHVARIGMAGGELVTGGRNLPAWAAMFAGAGLMVAGMGFADHLALVSHFGLQASHVGIGLVVAALAGLLVNKRLWLAGRIAGFATPGEAVGTYYGSITLRLVMMSLTVLFGLFYSAHLLSGAGQFIEAVTQGEIDRATAIWALAFLLFLPAVTGGWKALVLILAIEATVFAMLLGMVTGFGEIASGLPGFVQAGIKVAPGILADQIPGVIQYSAGFGKDVPVGGLFTTVGVLSHALSLIGIVLSPVMLHLVMTTRPGQSLGFGPVWLVAGLGGVVLLVLLPFLAARSGLDPAAYAIALSQDELFMGAGLAFLIVMSAQIAVSAFTGGGALLIAGELVLPYLLPGLTERGNRVAIRVTVAAAFFLAALSAAFAPVPSAILASLALPLSVQLFPALLGLAFVRWISRSAILTGLIIGSLVIFFTEPPGLVLVEGLFGDLPWGRFPLGVHSALWGLTLNVAAVLLVSIFTRKGAERAHRDRLHDEFAARWSTDFGGRIARGAKWSLTLIWAFLAIGPGAILGNTFFSRPIFTEGEALVGIPSLWVWQMFFWLIGVPLVWWLAYRSKLGLTTEDGVRPLQLVDPTEDRQAVRAPDWIAASLARITER